MILVRSVTLEKTLVNVRVGKWLSALSVEILPEDATNKKVRWCSSNPDIAAVNPNSGSIYGKSEGTAIIYAMSTDGTCRCAQCVVTVEPPIMVESVEVTPQSIALKRRHKKYLSAVVSPSDADNTSVIWHSENPEVASVDESSGEVSAEETGTTRIYATAQDGSGKSGYCTVTVHPPTLVESVAVTPQSVTLKKGQQQYLSVSVSPSGAEDKTVIWHSENPEVASVDESSGVVTAEGTGTTRIYATAQDGSGKSGYCTVTVHPPTLVESVVISPKLVTMSEGATKTFTVAISPSNAENKSVTWYSTKPAIASVDASTGKVTAKTSGITQIYATALDGSGKNDYCILTVKATKTDAIQKRPVNKSNRVLQADPVDTYSGAHLLSNTLMSLFGGQSLLLTANYNSTNLVNGALGVGWYHNFEKRVVDCGCQILQYENPSSYLVYGSTEDCSVFNCATPGKVGYVLTIGDCTDEYCYCIDCNSQKKEYYNADGLLVKVVDHQGFETIISHTDSLITITDKTTGKKIYLEKSCCDKIVRVYDDSSREAVLTYCGDLLTKIRDVNGNTLSYTYDNEGRVLYGTDSANIRYFENTYDEYGRVLSQKDSTGVNVTLFEYGEDGLRTVTNRNGDVLTRVFNEYGLLVKYVDENENEITYAYDENFNIIEETDGMGNAVKRTYNSFNKPTVITDKNGNQTTLSYDAAGNITKICYPECNGVIPEETFAYNSRNQLISHTDLRGTVTVYTYDANGLPLTKKVGAKNAVQYVYENGLLTSQTDAKGNTIRYGHNVLGQVTSKTDAQNHSTLYEYDLCGNLLKTTDPNGKTVINTYDGNYQKISTTDANGNTTRYSYNGNMKNTAVTLPDSNSIRYEYDGEDRPVKMIDQAGNVTVTGYDKGGRVVSKQTPDGGTTAYEYDKAGNVLKETNPKGGVTEKTYDAMGNVLSETDAGGNLTRYQYDSMSRPVRKINASSGVTLYTYSAAGDLLCETDALGNNKRYTYDDFGNKLTATDARGNTTVYTYDANNNLLTVTDPLGNTITNTYNSQNQLLTVTDAKNHTITYGYDALGRQTTVTDAKNNVFTTVYDGVGNVLTVIDAKGNTVSETVYNSLNLPATITDASGKTTVYTYNSLGKVSAVTDSLNNRQEYLYNSRGQNTQVKDALNNLSSASYDTLGNLTRLSGPLGGNTEYSYDTLGRLISETTTSGGTVTYGYNALNLKEQITNARGQNRKYTYDVLGRVTGYTAPEDSVSYTYDVNGNVLTVTDKNGTVTRTYDALNRVSSCTDTYGKTITYVYDAAGNLQRMVYPDNTVVTYEYDENNNLTKVTDWAGRVTAYTYDVNNRVVGVTKPDGSVTTTVYDDKQRIISTVEKTVSGAVITGFEYTYDELGRISTETHLAENTKLCYTYDNLSRVTGRTTIHLADNSETRETFTYDGAGNITGTSAGGTFVYDTNNRLTAYNGQVVTYDEDGNMLSAPLNGVTTAFEYDSANRLVRAGDHAYTYNGEDVRIRNRCTGHDTTYTYNTNAKLSQLLMKTTNGVVTKYVYGLGLIGEEKQGCFKTYHFDYRGSTVAITASNGQITDTFQYDTYGKLMGRTGSSFVIFGYNGKDGVVTDKNGLIYMRARYYSPELRRFVNADILAGEISNAVTLNRYAYANGNPVSNVDPFGLSADVRGDVKAQFPYGAVVYESEIYPIYVPSHKSGITYEKVWETIDNVPDRDFSFDELKFICGFSLDDLNGLDKAVGKNQIKVFGAIFTNGVLSSAYNSMSNTYLNFRFQKSGDDKRVIIEAGSSDVQNLYRAKANDMSYSVWASMAGDPLGQGIASSAYGDLYEKFTGQSPKWYEVYDVEISIDKAHRNSKYSSYLWINSDGEIMETPILYKNDKLVLGRRKGLLYFGFDPVITLPIDGSSPASDDYQELFSTAIIDNKISVF